MFIIEIIKDFRENKPKETKRHARDFLAMLNQQNKTSIRIISFLLIQVFLTAGAVYPEAGDRSLFKNKKPDYKKIQEERQAELNKSKDILSGRKAVRKTAPAGQDLASQIKISSIRDISSIYIPEEYGRVTQVYEAPANGQEAKKPLVVHIQDLHTNPEAAFNMANILDILVRDYSLGLVCSEGAEGEVDTSSVSSFPDAEVREKTTRLFVNSGELTGEEYLSITKYPDLPIWGIENKELYFDNIAEFNKIMEYSPKAVNVISQIKEALEKLKPKIYSAELLEIDLKEKEYEDGKLDTSQYFNYLLSQKNIPDIGKYRNVSLLKETMGYEKAISQESVKKESQILLTGLEAMLREKDNKYEIEVLSGKMALFKDQKMPPFLFYGYLEELARRHLGDKLDDYPNLLGFIDYLRKVNSLDSMRLFNEIEDLTYEIKGMLSRNENQKLLTRTVKHARILAGFFNLKLSNEELDYYLANKDDFKIVFFEDFLKPNLWKYNIEQFVDYNQDLVDSHFAELEHFYKIAHQRDIAMFNNAAREIEKRKVKTAALISGGFHTEGVTRLLKENGYSYVVIAPYSKTEIDEENYRYLLSGKRKPIEDLIDQLNEK